VEGLRSKAYLRAPLKRSDPFSLVVSLVGLGAVIFAATDSGSVRFLLNTRSLLVVLVGTAVIVLMQYDFGATLTSVAVALSSFRGTPDRAVRRILRQLDDAIVSNLQLGTLRDGSNLNGELLNDIVYMYRKGLLFEEIDSFVTSRISDEFLARQTAASMLRRAALAAPALGLFGTVIGLIGVLRALDDPKQIGPSMAFALLTTAYGSALSTLLLTPLAGRLEHHNTIYLESYKQVLTKIGILLTREERTMDTIHVPDTDTP
jgi:chemotaxis protein MotA